MKTIPAAKTILAILPQIDKYCEGQTMKNRRSAVYSYNSLKDSETLVNEIIEKTFNIDRLCNLKIQAYDLLSALPKNLGKILELTFIKNKTPDKVSAELNCTYRTFFRRRDKALELFALGLADIGINTFTFRSLLEQNRWIAEEYAAQCKEK